ncbi:MAG: YbaB/EbfC family nucleoid-associated protein [Sphingomicrobium sp.]
MPDFDEIMRMAANAQAELHKAQDTLETIEVEGQAGGGLVKIKATAKGRILGVEVDESMAAPGEKETLEDLITAAINDTRARADAVANDEMQKMSSGLGLPPGMKLPF